MFFLGGFGVKKQEKKAGGCFFYKYFGRTRIGWGNFVKVNWLASGCFFGWFKDEMISIFATRWVVVLELDILEDPSKM